MSRFIQYATTCSAAALLLFVLVACGGTDAATDDTGSADVSAWQDGDQYVLRLAPEQGRTFTITQTQRVVSDISVMGNEIQNEQDQTFTARMHIANRENGTTTLERTITRIQMESSGMGETMSYDSDDPESESPIADAMGPMLNKTISIDLREDGSFAGDRDELEAAMSELVEGDEQLEMLVSNMTDGFLNQFQFYPTESIAVGDSWTEEADVDLGVPLTLAMTYTLDSVEDTRAHISVEADIDSEGAPMEMGQGVSGEAFLTGSQSGTMVLDMPSGLLLESSMDGDISGFVELQAPGQDGPVDMDMDITTTESYGIEPADDE